MKATHAFPILALLAALCIASPHAQDGKTVTKAGQISATATIQAIDSTARTVTLRNEKGEEDTFSVAQGGRQDQSDLLRIAGLPVAQTGRSEQPFGRRTSSRTGQGDRPSRRRNCRATDPDGHSEGC